MPDRAAPPDIAEQLAQTLSGMLVRRFREAIYAAIEPGLPVPVRDGTYPVLAALRAGPATAAAISRAVGIDRTVASRQAAELTAAGLIRAAPDQADRRGSQLELTSAGRRVATTLHRRVVELVRTTMQDWPEADCQIFGDLLARFTVGIPQIAGQR